MYVDRDLARFVGANEELLVRPPWDDGRTYSFSNLRREYVYGPLKIEDYIYLMENRSWDDEGP